MLIYGGEEEQEEEGRAWLLPPPDMTAARSAAPAFARRLHTARLSRCLGGISCTQTYRQTGGGEEIRRMLQERGGIWRNEKIIINDVDMKRRLSFPPDRGDTGYDRKLKSVDPLQSVNCLHLLAKIDGISLSLVPTKEADRPTLEKDEDNFILHSIPDDMVLKSSVIVEANFDITSIARILSSAVAVNCERSKEYCYDSTCSKFAASINIWKYPPDTRSLDMHGWKKLKLLSTSKYHDVLDSLWTAGTSVADGTSDLDKFHRENIMTRMVQWQNALDSLATQWLAGHVSHFYIRGLTVHSVRALCYHRNWCGHVGEGASSRECIIHCCSVELYERMRRMGIHLSVLGDGSEEGSSSTGVRGGTNLAKTVGEQPLLIRGDVDIRGVIDCLAAVSLSLDAVSSYGRIALELPHLLCPAQFLHAVPVNCSSCTSYSDELKKRDYAHMTSTMLESPTTTEGIEEKSGLSKRKLHVMGPIRSECVKYLAMLLREMAQECAAARAASSTSHEHCLARGLLLAPSFRANHVYRDDIDRDVLDEAGGEFVGRRDLFSGGDGPLAGPEAALNPFKLVTSDPLENVSSRFGGTLVSNISSDVLKYSYNNKALASSLLQRSGAGEDEVSTALLAPGKLFFTIKNNASAQDFDFAYAMLQDDTISRTAEADRRDDREIRGGSVVSDVIWTEDMLTSSDEFDVYTISLPSRVVARTNLKMPEEPLDDESAVLLE